MNGDQFAEPDDLSEDTVLEILASIFQNAKAVIRDHRPGFYNKFVKLGTDLNRFSRHLKNSGLRKVYFHIGFMQNPLRESLNYDLRNRVQESLLDSPSGSEEGTRQFVMHAASNLTVSCLSDVDGRRIIDIDQFYDDISFSQANQEMDDLFAVKLLSAIDDIYDDFVETHSENVIEFLGDAINSCHEGRERAENKWFPVLATTSDKAIELDRRAISWQRSSR